MCIARTCKLSSMNSSCLVWITWDTYQDTNTPPVFLSKWWGAVEKHPCFVIATSGRSFLFSKECVGTTQSFYVGRCNICTNILEHSLHKQFYANLHL